MDTTMREKGNMRLVTGSMPMKADLQARPDVIPPARPLLDLNLNLLVVFASVFATRSTTLASQQLDMTQSAVSNALRRLRKHFGDPLFVRTPEGMSPTPLAERIVIPIQAGLKQICVGLEQSGQFVPMASQRRFTICTSDMGQLVLLPPLLAIAEKEAPGICIRILELAPLAAHTLMARGEIDIAIGTFPDW